MSGSGRGGDNRGNRRKFFRRHDRENDNCQEAQGRQGKKNSENSRLDKNRGGVFERPRWTPPRLAAEPLPVPDCPWCGKPIRNIASAISDQDTGQPVHFDCVLARISQRENLERGDMIAYIGGGRFGVIHFDNGEFQGRSENRNFKIKKILEWENKENRAEWRSHISDHYSET